MGSVIVRVLDPMLRESRLPNLRIESELLFCSIGEATLYILHCLFQWNLMIGSENGMEVVWHNHEFVEQEAPLASVARETRP